MKRLQRFPTNSDNIVEKFSCNSSESDCLLDKWCTCKSPVNVETFILNGEESESETSIVTTDESSDDSGDKHHVTFCNWHTLKKRIMKSKVDLPFNDALHMFKEDLKTLK